MAELAAHGYDSPRGKEALRVINRAHGRFAISNDDMRYVLSTFIYDPIDWIDRFGWRPLHEHERLARVPLLPARSARGWASATSPPTSMHSAGFKRGYEARDVPVRATTNAEIGRYTLDLLCGWYPRPAATRPCGSACGACSTRRMLDAFGFAPAPALGGRGNAGAGCTPGRRWWRCCRPGGSAGSAAIRATAPIPATLTATARPTSAPSARPRLDDHRNAEATVEGFTWWTLVPSTVGGLIGGGFAVLGMWITGRRERSRIREAHERETLLAARQVLLSIEDLYASDRAEDVPWELNPTGTQKQQRLLRELATHAAAVADGGVRELLELSTRAIGSAIVFQTQGDRYGQIAYQMCTHGRT